MNKLFEDSPAVAKKNSRCLAATRGPHESENGAPTKRRQLIHAKILDHSGPMASASLLGANLELALWPARALLSDRLENSKFCSPADERVGLAHGWLPIGGHMGNVQYELVRGMFLSGDESQLVNVYGSPGAGLIQTNVRLGANEELELEIWAKVRHHPVTLEVSLRPRPSRADAYSMAEVVIDTAYWKRYRVPLRSMREDHEAVFFIVFKNRGVVIFDQIHLRPVGEPHLSLAVQEAIGRMKLSTLRFPGGCQSTNYRWHLGIGPDHLRPSLPDPVAKLRAEYGFGTDEYLTLCHAHGTKPYITVNIGTGDPEEAGAWARYCTDWYIQRGLEVPEAYFQLGNEHYGIWESAHMTAPMYLEAVRHYSVAIRENYPRCAIIGLGEPLCGGAGGEPATELRSLMLKEARSFVDIIAINRYKGQWHENPQEQFRNALDSVLKIENDLRELIEDCRAAGFPPRVALPEWNYWLYAAHWDGREFFEPDDAHHAFFVAGMFHMMARLAPAMEVAAYEQLINGMGLLLNEKTHVVETAISRLFALYRPAFPGEVLPLEVDTPNLAPGIPQVDALALRNGEGLWVFVVNRSMDETVDFRLPESLGSAESARYFSAKSVEASLEEIEDFTTTDDGWLLPPLSVTRIKIEAASHPLASPK